MQTATGAAYYLLCPHPDQVRLDDVAIALAWTNRYGGHVGSYSVATHSSLISDWLSANGHPPEVAMAGLLHDSHEAFVGDLIWPYQLALAMAAASARGEELGAEDDPRDAAVLQAIRDLKNRADVAILSAFGLLGQVDLHHPVVKECDNRILIDEREALWAPGVNAGLDWFQGRDSPEPLGVEVDRESPERAMARWMSRFTDLCRALGVSLPPSKIRDGGL